MKIEELLTYITQSCHTNGSENPRVEAEILVSYALKLNRIQLYTESEENVNQSELEKTLNLLNRRLAHEPLQYLTHQVNFLGIDLLIEPPIFIPRPETEVLVQVLASISNPKNEPVIFDIGTGCGAIAIGCLKFLPQATVYASDVINLSLAQKNAQIAKLDKQIHFFRGSLFEPFKYKKADFIVSNPPYIPSSCIPQLQPEIRLFESRIALDGGDDGLFFIRTLIERAPSYLKSSGMLLLEISPEQKERIKEEAVNSNNFGEVQFINDFWDKPRVFLAKCA